MNKRIRKSVVLQHDSSDCGVACLLSVIKYYKGNATLEQLRESSGTSTQGTTLLGMYQAANSLGFDSQGCEADLQAIKEHGRPVILHVHTSKRTEHYVVCFSYENNRFVIGDPAKGLVLLSESELSDIWVSRKCLTLTPNNTFITSKQINRSKTKWLKQLIRDDIQILAISTLLGIIVSILGMSVSVFSQKLIDNIIPHQSKQHLVLGILAVFFLLIFRNIFTGLRQFLLLRQSKDFNIRIVDIFYSALLYLPKPFFDTRKIGELVARLNDTSRIQRVISQISGNVIIDILFAIVSFAFLFFYSAKAGFIALTVLPIYFVLIYRNNKVIINTQKQVMMSYALSESNYISTIQGINEIKNSNRQALFGAQNKMIYSNFQDKVYILGKINVKLSVISGVASSVFLLLILLITSLDVKNSNLMIGELMAILSISTMLLPSVSNLALISIPINEAKIAFDRMFDFANISPEKTEGENIKDINSIEIKNIAFRFVGRSQILNNISLELNKGEIISLIGESGSGKSTIAQILQRFYPTEKGEIIINQSINFKQLSTKSWRSHIEIVPQEIHLFNGTVVENIALSEQIDINHIISFCKQMGFHGFIQTLPQAYFTVIGEEGINLSGGQKQMVAFIRALYRNPKFLILDEATSAMDREMENFFLQVLEKIKTNTIILLITHRIKPTLISNRIYVLESGKIVTNGSPQYLLQSDNFFSRLMKDYSGLLYQSTI